MKRKIDEVDGDGTSQQPSLLDRIRSSWEFANLMQYIFVFGKALKIDEDLDIEDLETECIRPHSEKLSEIGLSLLKFVSSHRGLTPEIFDEYTRRQYVAKAPQRNPFGEDEEPKKFADFDVFTKLKVLHQLSVWTFWNPDRLRERMAERESDQTQWRIEPFGWDRDDRTYYLLDDDRIYRQTDPPPPAPPKTQPAKSKPKPKSKPKTKGHRSSKRQKLANGVAEESEEEIDERNGDAHEQEIEPKDEPKDEFQEDEDNGLGGSKWECIAITKEDYESLLDSIRKSRDPNEKELFKRIVAEVMPIIEKKAEAQERKAARQRKELENLEKMANAKRSSRIAVKAVKQKEAEEAAEADRKRQAELEMVAREQEKQRKLEEARESRMITREQRLKEREVKRILHEQELEKLKASHEAAETNGGRISERHTKAEMELRQKELERINEEDEEWDFDCAICGVHGRNLDDGTHSLACEKCGVWQHSKCHGIKEDEAERDDFHFFCASCNKPKVHSLKITMSSSSPPSREKKHDKEPKKRGRPPKPKIPAAPGANVPQPNGVPNGMPNGAHTYQPRPVARPPSNENAQPSTHPAPSSASHSHSYVPYQYNTLPPLTQYQNQQYRYAGQAYPQAPLQPFPRYSTTPEAHRQQAFMYPPHRDFGGDHRGPTPPGLQGQQQHPYQNISPQRLPDPYRREYQSVRPSSSESHNSTSMSPPPPAQRVQVQWSRPYSPQSYSDNAHSPLHLSPSQQTGNFGRPFSNSAAPPLSATQGSTDVRFAATHQSASPNTNAYAPVASQPAPAAYSPTKQTMSPPLTSQPPRRDEQRLMPAIGHFATGSPDTPAYQPPKHESNHIHWLPQTGGFTPAQRPNPASSPPSTLLPAPTLTPSVNTAPQRLDPPVKKPTPDKAAQDVPPRQMFSPTVSVGQHSLALPADTQAPDKLMHDLPPAPTLSPTAASHQSTAESPVKKPTPDKAARDFASAPTLSPTLNAHWHELGSPVKKPTPEKAAAAPAGLAPLLNSEHAEGS